jgi:hypothetical protein
MDIIVSDLNFDNVNLIIDPKLPGMPFMQVKRKCSLM